MELVYGNNNNVSKVREGEKTILERFQEFMKNRLLALRKLNLDSVSAQAALIESRNFFFNKNISSSQDNIVEASLYKEFDTNMYVLGISENINEYTELSIKEALGMSFKEYMDLPIYYKKIIKETLRYNIKKAEEEKANARKQQ